MFLAKRSNGIYYLYYEDQPGHRRHLSTRSRRKSDALKFVSTFRHDQQERQLIRQRISLTQFEREYSNYAKGVHTDSTWRTSAVALREFIRIAGDQPINRIGVREIELFLSDKRRAVRDITLRSYYGELAAAFETAKRWNYIQTNPFRLVPKPKAGEILPLYFTKEEFLKLIAGVTDKDFHDLIICAVLTGMRLSELTSLRWRDIDLEKQLIYVQNYEGFTTKS